MKKLSAYSIKQTIVFVIVTIIIIIINLYFPKIKYINVILFTILGFSVGRLIRAYDDGEFFRK